MECKSLSNDATWHSKTGPEDTILTALKKRERDSVSVYVIVDITE
jgi:hypothetical protein